VPYPFLGPLKVSLIQPTAARYVFLKLTTGQTTELNKCPKSVFYVVYKSDKTSKKDKKN